jgi:hypothetical protein
MVARFLPKRVLLGLFGFAVLALTSADAKVTKSITAFNATTVGEAVFAETGATVTSGGPAAGIYGLYAFTGTEGAGVFGRSLNGPGVVAETRGSTSPALYALNLTTGSNPGPALLAIGRSGEAISAESNDDSGIVGITRSTTHQLAAGVSGSLITSDEKDSGSLGTSYAGVLGMAGKYGAGVYGLSTGGQAIVGYNDAVKETGNFTSQAALYGFSQAGPGLVAYSIGGHSPDGYTSDRHAALGGVSVEGSGLSVFSSRSAGAKIGNGSRYDTLYLSDDYTSGKNYAIQVYTPAADANALLLDNSGNLTIAGTFLAKNGTRTQTQNPRSDRLTYAAQSTQATVEDVGSAELVDGHASVALAADFRETIDGSSVYAVFLTPYGDNRGLYVAQRTAAGFVVRESQGGQATLAFDYRIVARQYGAATGRLPHAPAPMPDGLIEQRAAVSGNPDVMGPESQIVDPASPRIP